MSFTFLDTKILVFTKPPITGKCKSRLVPALGEKGAAQLQARLLKKIITELVEFNLCAFEIWQTEPTSCFADLFVNKDVSVVVHTQQGNTLGERMSNAMQQTLQDVSRVIIIGSDCILYSKPYIKMAISCLNTESLVIGPAADGGYVLIGANQYYPAIFENISWGSSCVFQQTILKAQHKGIAYNVLEELWDIDTPSDLDKLKKVAPGILDFLP